MAYCEANNLDYSFGLDTTSTLRRHVKALETSMCTAGEATGKTHAAFRTHFAGDRTLCRPGDGGPDAPASPRSGVLVALGPTGSSAPKRSLWRKAQADTIRLRFLKVAAKNMDCATRVVVQSSSA